MRILAADVGTTSTKLGIYDEQLNEIATHQIHYDYQKIGNRAEINPELIYSSLIKGCAHFKELLPSIDVFAFDAFCPSLIAMDRNGNHLYPTIMHLDRRSFLQSRYAIKQLPKERFLQINGNLPFAGGISVSSMLWLKQNEPEIYNTAYVLGHMNTYLHKKLCDVFIIDPSHASFTGLYKTFTNDGWSEEIVGAMGLDGSKLPEVRPSLSLAGRLQSQAAHDLGLKAGTPVLVGANDSCSAAYGAGATKSGDIVNISGSSEIMQIVTDTPKPNEKHYCRTSMEDGTWLYLAITVGGIAVEWFKSQFCNEMDDSYFYDEYLRDVVACTTPPTVRFRPHLSGDRHSIARKTGGFSGLTLDTTREDMLRSLLYGTFEPTIKMMQLVEEYMPLNDTIYWTGGMLSEEYQKFKESIFPKHKFVVKKNCSLIGTVKAAIKVLNEQS